MSGRLVLAAALMVFTSSAFADKFSDAADLFRSAGASSVFFDNSYGYAIFPTVGKAGFFIGGGHGRGRVFVAGDPVGDTTLTQLSFGFQFGAQAYTEIIFFEDDRSFREFSQGNFEFAGQVNATVVTASAQATVGTTGTGAAASGGRKDADTVGGYHKGMAVFVIATGGLMFEASVGGQKFTYKPIDHALSGQ